MRFKYRFLGILGELIAIGFFVAIGYRLVSWRKRFGRLEADLIVRKGTETVLVEVKTSFSGNPERLFTAEKSRNLARLLAVSGGQISRTELFFVDFSMFLPRFRRGKSVCLR